MTAEAAYHEMGEQTTLERIASLLTKISRQLDEIANPAPTADKLAIQDAATLVGLSVSYLRDLARSGQAPATKSGGKFVFDRKELLKWKEARLTAQTMTETQLQSTAALINLRNKSRKSK